MIKKKEKLRKGLYKLLLIFVLMVIVVLILTLLIFKLIDNKELPQSDIIASEKEQK